jgi:hypothetical protein
MSTVNWNWHLANFPGGISTPHGSAELFTIYKDCICNAAKVVLRVANESSDGRNVMINMRAATEPDQAAPSEAFSTTTIDKYRNQRQPYMKTKFAVPNTTDKRSFTKIKQYLTYRNTLQSKTELDPTDTSYQVLSAPNSKMYTWIHYMWDQYSASASQLDLNCTLSVKFYVSFYNPIILNQ